MYKSLRKYENLYKVYKDYITKVASANFNNLFAEFMPIHYPLLVKSSSVSSDLYHKLVDEGLSPSILYKTMLLAVKQAFDEGRINAGVNGEYKHLFLRFFDPFGSVKKAVDESDIAQDSSRYDQFAEDSEDFNEQFSDQIDQMMTNVDRSNFENESSNSDAVVDEDNVNDDVEEKLPPRNENDLLDEFLRRAYSGGHSD